MRSLVLTLSLVLLASTAIVCAGSRQIRPRAGHISTTLYGDRVLAAPQEAAHAGAGARGGAPPRGGAACLPCPAVSGPARGGQTNHAHVD